MKTMKKITLLFVLCISQLSFCQELDSIPFLKEMTTQDISSLLTTTHFNYGTSDERIEKTQPLGYIGENYQRFYIHFSSAIKNPANPKQYIIYGKTRVKQNICDFQGTLEIEDAKTFFDLDFKDIQQGILSGTYQFFENPKQKGTGVLKGTFTAFFYLDSSGNIQYNALYFSAGAFANLLFKGTWTSFKSRKSKTCNWGDYRIPNSGDLDLGAGEFGVNSDYSNYGWENYIHAYQNTMDKERTRKALERENEAWWIEKK